MSITFFGIVGNVVCIMARLPSIGNVLEISGRTQAGGGPQPDAMNGYANGRDQLPHQPQAPQSRQTHGSPLLSQRSFNGAPTGPSYADPYQANLSHTRSRPMQTQVAQDLQSVRSDLDALTARVRSLPRLFEQPPGAAPMADPRSIDSDRYSDQHSNQDLLYSSSPPPPAWGPGSYQAGGYPGQSAGGYPGQPAPGYDMSLAIARLSQDVHQFAGTVASSMEAMEMRLGAMHREVHDIVQSLSTRLTLAESRLLLCERDSRADRIDVSAARLDASAARARQDKAQVHGQLL
eukprot:m.121869 g.121869  ORF g.121869 m.121869 type:complete len:291 (-) comp9302_c0_seq18:162-1034(-)